MDKEEAIAKVGKRVCIIEHVYRSVPAGTTGTVIHANLVGRFTHPDYGFSDVYELVVEWDLPVPILTTMGQGEYDGILTELG